MDVVAIKYILLGLLGLVDLILLICTYVFFKEAFVELNYDLTIIPYKEILI
jgi:hypothetical protein